MNLERLGIRRIPGIEEPFSVGDLSPGVNLILGPNGCGKTTLCRALRALLWPGEERLAGAEVQGWWRGRDGTARHAALVSGATRWQVGGEAVPDSPPLPPPHLRACFTLGLPDLLHEGAAETRLATEIRRQLAGGYDLDAAREAFPPAPSRDPAEARRLREATRERQRAEGESRDLADEERELARMQRAAARAAAAGTDGEVLRKAIHLHELEAERAGITSRLEEMPAGVARVQGSEKEILRDQRERLEAERQAATRIELELERMRREIRDPTPAETALDSHAIEEHLHRCDKASSLEGKLEERRTDEASALSTFQTAWRGLAATLPDEVSSGFPGGALEDRAIDEAEAFAERAEAWGRERPRRRAEVMGPLAALLLLAIGTALVIARLAGGASWIIALGLLLLAGTAGILVQLFLRAGRRAGSSPDPSPELSRRCHALRESARRLREHAQRRRDLQQQREEALAPVRAFLEPLGEEPAPDAAGARGRLERLRERLARAEAARKEQRDLELELAGHRKTQEQVEGNIRKLFEEAGLADGMDAQLGELLGLREEWMVKRLEARRLERECRLLRESLRDAILHTAGGRGAETRGQEAEPRGQEAEPRGQEAEPRGEEAEVSAAGGIRVLDLSEEQARALLARVEEESKGLAGLHEKIGQARANLDAAARSTGLEDALEEEQRAREALRERFEEALQSCAGQVLLEDVGETHERESSPALLRHAQDLFSRFTRGAFDLRVRKAASRATPRGGGGGREGGRGRTAASPSPGDFFAWDRRLEVGRALEELSDGTRVQLLLAARLAFAGHAERGTRLPLVLDEALATTDPDRFEAIARSLLEIARAEGRQVLYLGARDDEIARWREAAEAIGAPAPRAIDLALARGRPRAIREARELRVVRHRVPSPEGLTAEAYGAKLGVPRPDPFAPAGSLSLFHVLRGNLPLLHTLLRAGVATLGQWEGLARGGAAAEIAGEERAARVTAWVEVARGIVGAWREGRGRPVDRAAVEASGAVSGTFLAAVTALADSRRGDGHALLQALRDGQVARFQARKIDDLEGYLRERGHLDDRPPLSRAAILARALRDARPHLEQGTLEREEVIARVGEFVELLSHDSPAAAIGPEAAAPLA